MGASRFSLIVIGDVRITVSLADYGALRAGFHAGLIRTEPFTMTNGRAAWLNAYENGSVLIVEIVTLKDGFPHLILAVGSGIDGTNDFDTLMETVRTFCVE